MVPERLVRSAIVGIVLLSVVSAPVSAQGSSRAMYPLDQGAERIAEVTVDGQQYVIYRYENRLPYADGIEVFTDGERVTSRETVANVFTAYARIEGTTFHDGTVADLEAVARHAREVNRTAASTISALNGTAAYLDTLRNETVDNTTAWKRAVEAAPALEDSFGEGFGDSSAEELRAKLVQLRATARELEAHATTVRTLLERRRGGTEVNRSKLFSEYLATRSTIQELRSRINELNGSMAELAATSRTIAEDAGNVSEVAPALDERFTALAERLEAARGRLTSTREDLRSLRSALPTITRNEELHARLMKHWQARQGSAIEIYATFAEVGILIVAGFVAALEVR